MSGRRNPAKYAEQTAFQEQRIAVMERDDYRCRFEIAVSGLPAGETHFGLERIVERAGESSWVRCGDTQGLQTAHIFRRQKLTLARTDDGIPLKFHPYVAIAGCERCHTRFDHRQHRTVVRVPPGAVRLAKMLITHTHEAARARGEYVVDVDLTELD